MSKETNSTKFYKGFPVVSTDKSTGSVMDTDRPMQAPYKDKLIGPQSKTDFGIDNDKGA